MMEAEDLNRLKKAKFAEFEETVSKQIHFPLVKDTCKLQDTITKLKSEVQQKPKDKA